MRAKLLRRPRRCPEPSPLSRSSRSWSLGCHFHRTGASIWPLSFAALAPEPGLEGRSLDDGGPLFGAAEAADGARVDADEGAADAEAKEAVADSSELVCLDPPDPRARSAAEAEAEAEAAEEAWPDEGAAARVA
mmetsp:Transcript_41446/g.133716  ORF Transcript_41446/g.133716 Transcript_41446/m.133716 type:complete len:134 (+) Transcript_41446:253-654(+)